MSGMMLDSERTRTRRERTFVGSECIVCEEPLEHMLPGEKVLQLACSHVAHGACFYEYIKESDSQYCPSCHAPLQLDTSRGGNVLDIGKLNSIVNSSGSRSVTTPTSTPWDSQTKQSPTYESSVHSQIRAATALDRASSRGSRGGRETEETREPHGGSQSRDLKASNRDVAQPRTFRGRDDSVVEGTVSSVGRSTTATRPDPPRQSGIDVRLAETNLSSRMTLSTKYPIPSPLVTVRSEFPSLTRSRQQQTVTCLVTIEVPSSNWDRSLGALGDAPPPVSTIPRAKYTRPPSPAQSSQRFFPHESKQILEDVTENLRTRVDNWHGLDFSRFGELRLYGSIKVGKDKKSWQELECFLFAEMLVCVKERKAPTQRWEDLPSSQRPKYALKGSILIRKHLLAVIQTSSSSEQLGTTQKITAANLRHSDENILTLSLSVAELPYFHLQFENIGQLKYWRQALSGLTAVDHSPALTPDYEHDLEEEEWQRVRDVPRGSSVSSEAFGGFGRTSNTTAATDYSSRSRHAQPTPSIHVPIDMVVVVPISATMQGVKIGLVRDALRFMVANLGDHDRLGVVTFGSAGGGTALAGMTTKVWNGWEAVFSSIRPVGQKIHRADIVVDGANVAMDLLMQRKTNNPISTIILISDLTTTDPENVDFVVSRAEAAKVSIHSFGLGMTHKPDTLIELSTRTKASYTYVKDWMMLRECMAGCLGALQSMSHKNAKLKLRLPDGSPAKFVKIIGALQITKRSTGRDAEAALGDLRFGDRRDILVQLMIMPETGSSEAAALDHWDSVVSGLEALGGSMDNDDSGPLAIEEVPLIQADLSWGNLLRENSNSHLHRPSLLAITMLPTSTIIHKKSVWGAPTPPIPPHPSVIQRRMELLTSDMLTRALTLVSRGQHDRAQHLLNETRSILRGLGKGGLPPLPPPGIHKVHSSNFASTTTSPSSADAPEFFRRSPSPTRSVARSVSRKKSSERAPASNPNPGVDPAAVAALDMELESCLEWIAHPAVFARDSRKQALQAISVISSQRAFTFRTPIEGLWAKRLVGVTNLMIRSREWREDGSGEAGIMEER